MSACLSNNGMIVVVSGPSGSGKTTICKRLCAGPHGPMLSVSATTRPPRAGETEGVDYFFLSRDDFQRRASKGDFIEYAEYNGNLYGTPRSPLEKALAMGQVMLVEIDVQGAAQMRQVFPRGLYIFLDAPDHSVVEQRLERRNTESAEERRRRLDAAEHERGQSSGHFDCRIINDDLEATTRQIQGMIETWVNHRNLT
jgi:guanylate kinase